MIVVIMIPLLLLRLSQMKFWQKARIASFLCLSVIMIILTITRLAGGLHRSVRGEREFSIVWTHLLLNVESSVAILMACLVAFRTIFASHFAQLSQQGSTPWYHRLLSRFKSYPSGKRSTGNSDDGVAKQPHLSKGPTMHATMHTFRNFIGAGKSSNRGMTTLGSVSDPVEDYHHYIRDDTHTHHSRGATSTDDVSIRVGEPGLAIH
jgi:hypothetical protein